MDPFLKFLFSQWLDLRCGKRSVLLEIKLDKVIKGGIR